MRARFAWIGEDEEMFGRPGTTYEFAKYENIDRLDGELEKQRQEYAELEKRVDTKAINMRQVG
jgi:hypothetical protein